MAVPTTLTATVGAKMTAANWNTYARDPFAFLLSPPRCSVYQTATTSMATSGTAQLILFDTEAYDTDTMHSTVTNTSRIVATTAGLYTCNVVLASAFNATGYRQADIRKNAAGSAVGGTSITANAIQAAPTVPTRQALTFDVQMAANDYLELFGTQTSGGALATVAALNGTLFQMRWVASS
jgi:hypothetical protein